jgi:hypothetical protein
LAGQADFSSDEWAMMRRAMLGAAVLVSISEGGKEDMLSETLAVTGQLRVARLRHPNQLVRELATIARFQAGREPGMTVAEFEVQALNTLRAAAAVVAAKAPADLAAFTEFVISLANTAANAHKEGGFMGIGGVRVTPAEAAAIARIKDVLGG